MNEDPNDNENVQGRLGRTDDNGDGRRSQDRSRRGAPHIYSKLFNRSYHHQG